MRLKSLCNIAIGFVFMACTLPVGLAAQTSADTDKKVADLEKQLQAIRAELDAIKSAPAPAAAVATPAAAPATNPLAGITSVLGGVNLTGLVDVYYGYNANHPAAGNSLEPFTPRNNQFSLNLLELQLDKPVDKTSPLGFRVALGFGNAIDAINSASAPDNGVAQYLKEGYLSYMAPIGKGLQIDAGKFVTPAGFEVIETNQNWNYSRGLLFYEAIPYYHLGVRAKYTFNDKWSITGYATNGWNNIVATNSGKTGGFSLAWNATKKLSITENFLTGPRDSTYIGDDGSWNNLSDTVVTYNPTAKLSIAGEFDYDHQGVNRNLANSLETNLTGMDYTGVAGFVKYAFSPKAAVAARYEYLNDHDGLATFTGIPQHLQEFTATVERKFATHLISRLEYRHDNSNQTYFQYGATPFAVKGQDTVKVGLVFVLEPNDTK